MPKIIGSIIWDIGFPCITSAFSLIQLAFLQLTQVILTMQNCSRYKETSLTYNLIKFQLKFGPQNIQKESCVSLIITGHFFFVIASDIALTSPNCYVVIYVVQCMFLIWSILLYLTFLHAGYKILQLLKTIPNSMLVRDNSNSHQKGLFLQISLNIPINKLLNHNRIQGG